MKGDQASDVHCPLCPWTGHPRRSGANGYDQTPRTAERASLRQHLTNAHPGLSSRDRVLLLDAVIPSEGPVPSYEYSERHTTPPCSPGDF